MSLKSLITKQVDYTAELPFPLATGDSIQFTLRYLPRVVFRNLSQSCQSMQFDQAEKRPILKTDNEKLLTKILKECLISWKGLTYRLLPSLIPVDPAQLRKEADKVGGLDAEIPFDPSNPEHLEFAVALFNNSYSLESWIMEQIMELSNFQLIPKVEQSKNSESSPSGN